MPAERGPRADSGVDPDRDVAHDNLVQRQSVASKAVSVGADFRRPRGIAFSPWRDCPSQDPAPRSVPVTVITLSKDEGVNIERCLRSTGWADQHLVIDSGSADGTLDLAAACGATVFHRPWSGFGDQRRYALSLDEIRNDWVYFVDADEWTSAALAREIRDRIASSEFDGYTHRLRLVFGDVWMRHGGWYQGSWVVRLARRTAASFDSQQTFAERMIISSGRVGRLTCDIVDHDLKGISAWVEKHARYASLVAEARSAALTSGSRPPGMAAGRWLLTRYVVPRTPLRPLARFIYMFVIRGGFLHGRIGFRFAALHACVDFQAGVISKFTREGLR